MIEVVAVLVIMGIVSAFAVCRMGTPQYDLVAQTDILKTYPRFTQPTALAAG